MIILKMVHCGKWQKLTGEIPMLQDGWVLADELSRMEKLLMLYIPIILGGRT